MRARYWEDGHQRQHWPKTHGSTILTCKQCGKSFKRPLHEEARRRKDSDHLNGGVYCSLECYRSRTADAEVVRARQRVRIAEWRKRNRLYVSAYKRARFLPKDSVDDHDYIQVLLGDPCSYCGDKAESVDHIVALSRGGDNNWTNLTAACRSCNSRKATKKMLFMACANHKEVG
jgi:5-methylcytosine-specific restriction endonuclease McrA